MPRVSEYQGIQFAGFSKGLNNHTDSSRIQPDELSFARDIRIGPRGELKLRTGYTRLDTNLVGNAQFLHAWRDASGDDLIFGVTTTNELFYARENSSNFPIGPVMNHGNNLQYYGIGWAGTDGALYIGSKSTVVQKYDTYGGWQPAVTSIPNGKMMHYRHNRLFVINTVANASRIWYSELGDYENFPPDNWIDVDPEDGFELNASEMFGDDLIVFKDNSMWKLSGRTPSSFSLYRIDNHRGCVSPEATTQLRGRLFFHDRDTGVWAFDGTNLELVSQPINDYIVDGVYYEGAWTASMYSGNDRVYLSMGWGDGSTRRAFVWRGDVQGWTEYSRGFTGNAFHRSQRYLGFRFTGGLWIADPSSTQHEQLNPITALVRTGWVLLGGPGVKARMRRLEMTVKANIGSTGTVRMYRDFDESAPYLTHTFDGGPAVASLAASERRITLDGWGDRLHAVMLEFEFDEPPFQINEFTLFYTGGIDVRGES